MHPGWTATTVNASGFNASASLSVSRLDAALEAESVREVVEVVVSTMYIRGESTDAGGPLTRRRHGELARLAREPPRIGAHEQDRLGPALAEERKKRLRDGQGPERVGTEVDFE